MVLQTLHHVDIDTVMITLSCNLVLYSCSSLKPKVPVNTICKKQKKSDTAQGTAREEEGQKWLDAILRTFHKTAMLFLTSWSFSSREIAKSFKRRILETKFHNSVECRKAQAQK